MAEPITPAGAPMAPPPPPAPQRGPSHPWRWLVAALASAVVLVALAAGAVTWALTTQGGTARLLSWLPGVAVREPKGSLIGDFSAERFEVELKGTGTLRLEQPAWQGLRLARSDHGRWLLLSIDRLHADQATFTPQPASAPGKKEPLAVPASLRLPVEVIVRDASVDAFRYGGAEAMPLRALHLALHLGAEGGALHRADALAVRYDKVSASGSARIAADPPFAVSAQVGVQAAESTPAFRAGLAAVGPLAKLDLAARVQVDAGATHGPQSADMHAVALPFAAWPLGALQASTSALDLSAFASAAPATSLSGRVVVQSSGFDQPAQVSIELANARAGRVTEGLLPVRRMNAALRARPDEASVLDVQSLHIDLGSEASPGGSLSGTGHWAPAGATLDLHVNQLRPAALDARAPQTTLDGEIRIVGTGLSGGVDAAAIDVVAQITGQLLDPRLPRAAPRNARLRVQARASPLQIELRAFEARLGETIADLSGKLTRAKVDAPWRAAGKLAVANFDPAPWWPGAGDSALARGRNALNAKGSFDLVLPTTAGTTPYDALNATRGRADLSIVGSVLAGVPLEGQATFVNNDGQARPTLEITAAGNRLSAHGRFAPKGSAADQWQLTLDAPQLDRLAPLLAPAGPPAGKPSLAGSVKLQAAVAGRWPEMSSDGDLAADAVRYGDLTLRRAEGRWQLSTADSARVDATLLVNDLTTAGRTIQQARGRIEGTARAHNATLRIESQALPPAWADALVATAAANGIVTNATSARIASLPGPAASGAATSAPSPAGRSEIVLTATGGLVDADGQRLAGWRGRINELAARSLEGPRRTWLQATGVNGSVTWGSGPLRVQVEPGRAEALGATLRWNRIVYRGASAASAATLDLQAAIDPLAIAPILQQLQPGFGWRGDLALGARIDVKSTPAIHAAIVVERARGDLAIVQEYGTQPLGLAELRVALTADNGLWHGTARVAGASFGSASADVTARAASATAWPAAATPIGGSLDVRIADLASLGSWVPAGWRIGGVLRANAALGGTLGTPTYTGRLEGSQLSARNFLQGVDATDGALLMSLDGDTARIERFTAKGGKGTLSLSGSARLGATPTADVRILADKFQLLGRVDRRIVASGAATLRLDAKAVGLKGEFKVDEGLVDFTRADAPSLGDDVEVVRRPGGSPSPAAETKSLAATPAAPEVGRQVNLDLRINVGEQLRIRGRGLDASLRGEMHLTSPDGRIAVDGSIRAVDGTYQAYGQKLGIDRAIISFVGPLDNPRLDIEATRPDLDVRVGVLVTGTVLNPRVRLFSEPDMSDVDKLSWLVLGKASTAAGGNESALLQRAALGLLSGEGPGVTDRVTKALGLDELSVRSGDNGVKDTIVSVGKQLSKRWYVGYEQGLNSTAGSWQLIYRLAQRFTVKAQAGGDNAVDVNWTLRWK